MKKVYSYIFPSQSMCFMYFYKGLLSYWLDWKSFRNLLVDQLLYVLMCLQVFVEAFGDRCLCYPFICCITETNTKACNNFIQDWTEYTGSKVKVQCSLCAVEFLRCVVYFLILSPTYEWVECYINSNSSPSNKQASFRCFLCFGKLSDHGSVWLPAAWLLSLNSILKLLFWSCYKPLSAFLFFLPMSIANACASTCSCSSRSLVFSS